MSLHVTPPDNLKPESFIIAGPGLLCYMNSYSVLLRTEFDSPSHPTNPTFVDVFYVTVAGFENAVLACQQYMHKRSTRMVYSDVYYCIYRICGSLRKTPNSVLRESIQFTILLVTS